jgi:transcriptional regulator with PAS, ATPase and Fis domain
MADISPSDRAGSNKNANDQPRKTRSSLEAIVQRSADPVFILNRRRLIFVNHAFEALAGAKAADLLGQLCSSRSTYAAGAGSELLRILMPPPEVFQGRCFRASRTLTAGNGYLLGCEIDFLPLQTEASDTSSIADRTGEPFSATFVTGNERSGVRLVLGKVTVVRKSLKAKETPLPEKLRALRDRLAERYRLDQLTSQVPTMVRAVNQIGLAARSRATVLIKGEPGTGKRWIARTIHFHGDERAGPFIQVDCSRLTEELLSDLLAGDKCVLGRSGPGTLYLRDPERLPEHLQVALCEWLKEEDPARLRLITGSSHGLTDQANAGNILPELSALIGTLVLEVPPLRARLADLDRFVDVVLTRFDDADTALARGVSSEARHVLMSYDWPGNLRELREVLLRATRHATGEIIELADLPAYIRLLVRLEQTPAAEAERSLPLDQILGQVEQRLIHLALRLTKGNKTKAADLLAIPRPRLWRRLDGLE